MDQIINHAVLSLDFWQDTVTYEGCTMPAGTIGCEVLNIPESTIEKLDTPCNVLNQLLQGMNTGSLDMELLPQVQQAAGEIISFLQVSSTQPVSMLNSQESNVFIMLSSNIGSVNKKNSRLIPVRNQTGVSYAPENRQLTVDK